MTNVTFNINSHDLKVKSQIIITITNIQKEINGHKIIILNLIIRDFFASIRVYNV